MTKAQRVPTGEKTRKKGRNRHGSGSFSDWVRKDKNGQTRKLGRKAAIEMERGADGKRKRRWFYGKSDSDVQQQIAEYRKQQERGIEVVRSPQETVGKYLTDWLQGAGALTVKPITLDSYERKVRVHIIPALGHIKLRELRPAHLVAFYARMRRDGLSKRTIQYCHAILHKALNDAVEVLQILPYNIAVHVKPPKPDKKDPVVITPDDVSRVCNEIMADWMYTLFYVAIASGCRRGELCALRWEDIDWDRRTLRVDESTQELNQDDGDMDPAAVKRRKPHKVKRLVPLPGSGITYDDVKTNSSRRTVKLAEEDMMVLRFQQQLQSLVREKAGPKWKDFSFVFTNACGEGLRPSTVSNHWLLIRTRAGLPNVVFHGLRHTNATLMLLAGVHPRVAAERLGHASTQLFMELYGKVLDTLQDDTADKIAKQIRVPVPELPKKV